MSGLTRLLVVLLTLAAAGCGVSAQERPQPLVAASTPGAPSVGQPRRGAMLLPVYFVSADRLVPVSRSLAEATPQAALDALVAGPPHEDVLAGVRTALAPQPLRVLARDGTSPQTVVIAADGELATVSGRDQLLAVAQLVWTATELPGVQRVRLLVQGTPVEVPTDQGLVRRPVGRGDYASVAPPPPAETPAPTPPAVPAAEPAPRPPGGVDGSG